MYDNNKEVQQRFINHVVHSLGPNLSLLLTVTDVQIWSYIYKKLDRECCQSFLAVSPTNVLCTMPSLGRYRLLRGEINPGVTPSSAQYGMDQY